MAKVLALNTFEERFGTKEFVEASKELDESEKRYLLAAGWNHKPGRGWMHSHTKGRTFTRTSAVKITREAVVERFLDGQTNL